MPCKVLILGIGNLLWADEGFGVRAVEYLDRHYVAPQGVQLLDGGTQGLYLVNEICAAQRLLILDAIDWRLTPGTVRLIQGSEVPSYLGVGKLSLHQTSFQEVLATAQLMGWQAEALALVGVQPQRLDDYGGSLSAPVAASMDEAIALAGGVLDEWGWPLQSRSHPTQASQLNDPALARHLYEQGRPDERTAWRHGDLRFVEGG